VNSLADAVLSTAETESDQSCGFDSQEPVDQHSATSISVTTDIKPESTHRPPMPFVTVKVEDFYSAPS